MFNVVIEGADGVGKSTLINALSLECQNLFRNHLGVLKFKTLREPGGTRLGEYIREHVIFPVDEVDYDKHYAKRLGYILSHADLAYELKKLKEDGYAILLDRFSPISNRVYEAFGSQRDVSWAEPIYERISEVYKPDLIIYLRPETPGIVIDRWRGDKHQANYYDREGEDFKRRIIEGYDVVCGQMSSIYNIHPLTFNASESPEKIARRAKKMIASHYGYTCLEDLAMYGKKEVL